MPKVYNKRDTHPADAVYVGRPSKYGNPFPMRSEEERNKVIKEYIRWFTTQPEEFQDDAVRELRGKDLVCWCAPKPCHADFLLIFVNTQGEYE